MQGLFVLAVGIFLSGLPGQAAELSSAPAILQELRNFREMGSVLYIAAHPDDENTVLITYLARGRNYRTAYLSLTRGDGGQNLLGPELGEELGVARTQELLAARRLDGGQQFFSRAIDFGFSKDYRETLNIWDKQQVLSDMVRVIRTFRPDVLITRFSPIPGGTHGHHTASTVLAIEAFKLAGDTNAFPEQLAELSVWQPKRILQNSGGGTNIPALRMDVSGNDPVTGESFSAIAARSRAMHKTQGFGNFGGFGGGGARAESFQLLGGEPATNDILDGIDTTWSRVSGGAAVGQLADDTISQFNSQDLAANVPALLKIKKLLAALPADRVVDEKRRQLDHLLQECLGLSVETTIAQAEVVPGETLKLHHVVNVHSSVPVRWLTVRYSGIKTELDEAIELNTNNPAIRDTTQTLPVGTPLSQPYWLREDGTPGMFRVDEASLIGRPENPPAFPMAQVFEVGGQKLVIADEPVQITADPVKGEVRRRLDVIAPVSLRFVSDVKLFAPGTSKPVEVEIVAARADAAGTLQLDRLADWNIAPAKQSFHLAKVGDKTRLTFTVTAPAQPATAQITARAEIDGAFFDNQRIEIHYDHIPLLLLQPRARLKAVSLELAVRGGKIGYLPGAGDSVAESLQEMGYEVTPLTGADLTTNRLANFDAVVIGIRAFNTRTDLVSQLPDLFAYVEAGGNVVVQYNRPGNDLKTDQLAPYRLRLSQDRVTDENATMTFLATNHPALNTPNKITSADFNGWVQERGVYFPNQWDEHFTPILACNDAGESPKSGGLLVAQYGKGYFVYTGLAFFRQLPAGVPGAYRLFANLVSLGK
jgi:LmbE family N-acetylglucosaminyl deacetylase